jgi:hypothetical protein
MTACLCDVRFTPESGHSPWAFRRLLCVKGLWLGTNRAAIVRRPKHREDTMNARLAYLLLAVGAVGMSASAYAQSADPSVVKVPADIEYKGLTGAPQRAVECGLFAGSE